MKIAHECPISIFEGVRQATDYDYALVHLFEESEEYLNLFKYRPRNREMILDNSLFELEVPFDPDNFAWWIDEVQPDWYIIPDKLEDAEYTISSAVDWIVKYGPYLKSKYSKSIGVVQGRNYEEVRRCYLSIAPLVDKVAFSFDYSFFLDGASKETKFFQYMKGRQNLLEQLLSEGIIDVHKPHHLLGCSLPQEFRSYHDYEWIDTIDTSNPVVHGMLGIRYGVGGLQSKSSQKLYELIHSPVSEKQRSDIGYNIGMFRMFCGRP